MFPGLIDTQGHLHLRYGEAGPAGVQGLNAQSMDTDGIQMLLMVRDASAVLLCGNKAHLVMKGGERFDTHSRR